MNPAPILPVTEIDHVETTKAAAASLRLGRDGWHRRTWLRGWNGESITEAIRKAAAKWPLNPRRCTGGMICYGAPF